MKQARGAVLIILYVSHDLRGELVAKLNPAERWVWFALRMLTAESPYRPVLCIAPSVPFTDSQIADQIMVPISLWKKTKRKLEREGIIEVKPRLGISIPHWREMGERTYHWKLKRGIGTVHFTEEDLKADRDLRRRLMSIYASITGKTFEIDNFVLTERIRDRIAEGATPADLEIALRTYCKFAQEGSLCVNKKIAPVHAFSPEAFWKWRAKNQPVYSRVQSTLEYLRSIQDMKKRRIATNFAKQYFQDIKMTMRRNGWGAMVDVDYTKNQTCKQYVVSKTEG